MSHQSLAGNYLAHLAKRETPASREELANELNLTGEEPLEALRRRCVRWNVMGNWSSPVVSATPCQSVWIYCAVRLLVTVMAMAFAG